MAMRLEKVKKNHKQAQIRGDREPSTKLADQLHTTILQFFYELYHTHRRDVTFYRRRVSNWNSL